MAALKEVAPEGIDMYFENVGGYFFNAAFDSLRPRGRIALCGAISEYNTSSPPTVTFNQMKMVYTFQRIEGFMCAPWLSGKQGNFLEDMHKWHLEGKLVCRYNNLSDSVLFSHSLPLHNISFFLYYSFVFLSSRSTQVVEETFFDGIGIYLFCWY